MVDRDPCEICLTEEAETIQLDDYEIHQNCPQCGNFKLTFETSPSILRQGLGPEFRAKVSAWVRDQNRNGTVPIMNNDTIQKIVNPAPQPQAFQP